MLIDSARMAERLAMDCISTNLSSIQGRNF